MRQNPEAEVPTDLLEHSQLTEVVSPEILIAVEYFQTKGEAARYLSARLGKTRAEEIATDAGLWTWLSVPYFDSLCPVLNGSRVVKNDYYYVFEPKNSRHFYRHLFFVSWQLLQLAPVHNNLFMRTRLSSLDSITTEVMKRLYLTRLRCIFEVLERLYWDPVRRKPRSGITGSKVIAGNLRYRRPQRISQLEKTYDLMSLNADNTGIFTYVWMLRNDKPETHQGRVMLIDARQQFEKEPKYFGNKRKRITDTHRAWIEERYQNGWADGYCDEHVKIFNRDDFAYHKVNVVFWQTDENDKPAMITEPYEKSLTAANVKKELDFHESELKFRVSAKVKGKAKTIEFTVNPDDDLRTIIREALSEIDETVSVEWTHRHYVKDDEYIPHGEDIEAFLKREIAKPIIRWEDSPQIGYEILPNKYFFRHEPPTPAKDLLKEFWRLEKEAEKLLEGLAQ